ncbi:hypothetical protein LJB81_00085 [Desulfovibrio sp. OttesenSCG-928-M14]|nr:hypothetical protein [Desulfovibrio sp. OttesenSCG-928-M14]
MKHAIRLFIILLRRAKARLSPLGYAFCIFLCALPAQSLAAEMTIRNTETCGAKVALAYLRDGVGVVEGWHKLAPGQAVTIRLFAVSENDVYAHVVFEYPKIVQLTEKGSPTVERSVQDTHFRYSGTPTDNPALRKALFQHVPPQKHGSRDDGDRQEDRGLQLILRSAVN